MNFEDGMMVNLDKLAEALSDPKGFIKKEYCYMPGRVGDKALELMGVKTGNEIAQSFIEFYDSDDATDWNATDLVAVMGIISTFCAEFGRVIFEVLAQTKIYGTEIKEAINAHTAIDDDLSDKIVALLESLEPLANEQGPTPWPEGYIIP